MAKKVFTSVPTNTNLLNEAQMVIQNRWTYVGQHYQLQEQVIDDLFKHYAPQNTDENIVRTKAETLNIYYNTSVIAIAKMAKEIVNLKIDNRLKKKDLSLVPDIANAVNKNRQFTSFASKYCAAHKPDGYPIYDSLVRNYLAQVIGKGNLANYTCCMTTAENMMHDYLKYVDVYNAFIAQYNLSSLSYRDVDWYIWVANKNIQTLSQLNLFKLI